MLSPAVAPAALVAGTDLVSVSEVTASIERFGERYLERVYTPAERADCAGVPKAAAAGLAARFAAKEAALKALDPHEEGIDWRQVEITRSSSGRPELALHGAAAELARRRGLASVAVSMSHHGELAHAVVVGFCTGGQGPGGPQGAGGAAEHAEHAEPAQLAEPEVEATGPTSREER